MKATQKSNITRSNGNSATAAAASLSVGGNNRGTGSGLSTERLIIEGRVLGLWNPPPPTYGQPYAPKSPANKNTYSCS